MLSDKAPAKVNLSLHVVGRRADGYHLLESLVVFASCHDRLNLEADRELGIMVSGPRAAFAGPDADNLVLKAARALAERLPGIRLGHFALEKHLPAAAGLGGGSSDAAAALRLLCQLNDIALDAEPVRAAALAAGADVPVCLARTPAMMRGIGETVEPVHGLPSLQGVLVNPGKPVETRAVFSALGVTPGVSKLEKAHPVLRPSAEAGEFIGQLQTLRNDLEPPACLLEPAVSDAMEALRATNPALTRMSGSGATVFALYQAAEAAQAAARLVAARHPGWWVEAVALG